MSYESISGADANIIPLDNFRRGLDAVRLRLMEAKETSAVRHRPSMDTVFFITGGRYEAMVNGAVGVLDAGDFLRVPEGGTYGFSDIGTMNGAMVAHRFPRGVEAGFLREIAAAMPPFSTTLPRRGTPAFARLCAIARRWGITIDTDAAA
ncbi:MAG TPA: hypothetical protein VL418_07350 [Devosiaceae bacterium]|jgi:hypothetical protein|nr:hypothetical protein [Devosiaceae bacterium]